MSSQVEATPFDSFPPGVREDIDGLIWLGYLEDSFSFCVIPQLLVTMGDGTRKPIEEVQAGDAVLTHDGVGIVTRTFTRDYHGSVRHITKAGYPFPLVVTEGHELLTQHPPHWVASELIDSSHWVTSAYPTEERMASFDIAQLLPDYECKAGQVYAASVHEHPDYRSPGSTYTLRRTSRNGLPRHLSLTPELMTLAGYWLAEGNLEDLRPDGQYGRVCWTLHRDETQYADEIDAALASLGAGQCRRYISGNRLRLKLGNTPLAALLTHLCGQGSRDRVLAPEIMLAPKALQRVLIDKWNNGDGSETGRYRDTRTSADMLARQMYDIAARIQTMPPHLSRRSNSGGPSNRSHTGVINILGHGQTRANASRHKVADGYSAHMVKGNDSHPYEGRVHNLEVYPQNSYVVEGTVVHNCGHDFVIRVLRGDEELLAGLVMKDYTETVGQAKAHVWATIALALVAVDGAEDFCPQATPNKKDFARARFQWATSNWYWPLALVVYGKYTDLLKRQQEALDALEDFCSGSLPTFTPFASSSTDKAPSESPQEDIRDYLEPEED